MDKPGHDRPVHCGTTEAGLEEPRWNSVPWSLYDLTRVKGHDDDDDGIKNVSRSTVYIRQQRRRIRHHHLLTAQADLAFGPKHVSKTAEMGRPGF